MRRFKKPGWRALSPAHPEIKSNWKPYGHYKECLARSDASTLLTRSPADTKNGRTYFNTPTPLQHTSASDLIPSTSSPPQPRSRGNNLWEAPGTFYVKASDPIHAW